MIPKLLGASLFLPYSFITAHHLTHHQIQLGIGQKRPNLTPATFLLGTVDHSRSRGFSMDPSLLVLHHSLQLTEYTCGGRQEVCLLKLMYSFEEVQGILLKSMLMGKAEK